jgi:toxin HigB-1
MEVYFCDSCGNIIKIRIAVIFQHDSELPGCGYGAALANGAKPKDSRNLRIRALKKLFLLHASVMLDNLSVPPGNRLEVLHGQRKGQHSIRINDQYRICFVWREGSL